MKKRIISIALSTTLILSNLNGLEINAADKVEVNTITLEESEEVSKLIDGVLYISEGVTRIEDNEFDGYGIRWNENEGEYATKIVLPSTLEYIGNSAFASSVIEEIVIPGNVKEIGDDAFWGCDNLKKVIIEDGVEKIGSCLFCNCKKLETAVMPKSVKEWDTTCAFMWCYSLQNVTLPEEGMDTMGTGMFYLCESLEELTIPDCVTTMNYGVTSGCDNLKLLKAGKNVVNFVAEEEPYPYSSVNFTLGCFGTSCKDMVLEAPLDSAIVEYARDYRYFTVKYDYPDFERMEYICDGVMQENTKVATDNKELYMVVINEKSYPGDTTYGKSQYNVLKTNILNKDGNSPIGKNDYGSTIFVDARDNYWAPSISFFRYDYYTQDENLDLTVKHTDYFKLTLTKQSLEEKRVQIEILKFGTWDSENAEWELITPAIDTTILTPTPTAIPTKTVIPTGTAVTPEPEEIPQNVPKVTEIPAASTSKPVVTKRVTPTPSVKVVKPAKTSIKSVKQPVVKKQGKKIYKKEVKLSWKKVKNADGYKIYMKSGNEKYKAVKTISNGKTVSYTKKNLKKGKTYYFKVRAYCKVNGKKVYGSYSGVKKVKVR